MGKRVLAAMILAISLVSGTAAVGQTATAVQNLDLSRFAGNWYVITWIPAHRDKRCDHDAVVLVAQGDRKNSLQFVNACQTKAGFTDVQNVNGKPQDKSGDGKLKVTTLWPFSRKLWAFAVDPNYDWVLVGNPNHKQALILAKTGNLDPAVLVEIQAKAAAQGFNLSKFVMMPQTRRYQVY